MGPKWKRVRDAQDGDAVKKAGAVYLPKLTGQDGQASGGVQAVAGTGASSAGKEYNAYKKRALYYGASQRTLQGISGLVFRKDLQIEGAPKGENVQTILENASMLGISLYRFAQSVFDETLLMGRCGIYVTLPKGEVQGARAFLTLYTAEQILSWRTVMTPDGPRHDRIILEETVEEADTDDEYVTKQTTQIRELFMNGGVFTVRVWKKDGREWAAAETIIPLVRGETMDHIPFYFVGPRGNHPDVQEPPLLPLADANLHHYRLSADYAHGLHFTALPTAVVAGFPAETTLLIGSGTAWVTSEVNAKAFMLEYTGQGLGALENALDVTVGYMASLGARLIEAEKKAAETAETHHLRQWREQASNASAVMAVGAALSNATTKMLDMSGIVAEVTTVLNNDLVDAKLQPAELLALVKSWQDGAISYETLYHNIEKGEITRPKITAEEEAERLRVAAGANGGTAA
jgi:hypothetical protein